MNTPPGSGPHTFGIFLSPYHRPDQNPTLALETDLDMVVQVDRLGFDEAWIGEHHSGGNLLITSPEVFIAAAAERTRHVRFGTGVITLSLHHPLMVADRLVLLDHLTRGRVMLGVGPGALTSDARLIGVDVSRQREMLAEALEVVLALLRGTEPVTRVTDWFQLHDARLQLRPYSRGGIEVAVAGAVSPSAPLIAGRLGCSLLSIAGTARDGFNTLGRHWEIMERQAAEHGTRVDRAGWRISGPVHLAASYEQALEDVRFGLADWVRYFNRVANVPMPPDMDDVEALAANLNNSGFGIIGTPRYAVERIEQLGRQTGGFGGYLLMWHEWADLAPTLRSHELFARYVIPHFTGALDSVRASHDQLVDNHRELLGASGDAIDSAIRDHIDAGGQYNERVLNAVMAES